MRHETGEKYRKKNWEIIKKKNRKNWGDKHREYHRAYRKRDYVRDRLNRQQTERRKNDIQYRLKARLRARLRKVLSLKGIRKCDKTMALVGCSLPEFQVWIASKFVYPMTWAHVANGKVHIDHIIPCATFDLTNPEQQRKCFHYTNLQPLWREDNMKKGVRLDWTAEPNPVALDPIGLDSTTQTEPTPKT